MKVLHIQLFILEDLIHFTFGHWTSNKKCEPHPVYFPPKVSFFGGVPFVLVNVVFGGTFGVLTLSIRSFLPPAPAVLPGFVLNDVAAGLARNSLIFEYSRHWLFQSADTGNCYVNK